MTKEQKQILKHSQIQARTAWKLVDAICAVHGIHNDYRDEDSFYSILYKKCGEEAKKEVDAEG